MEGLDGDAAQTTNDSYAAEPAMLGDDEDLSDTQALHVEPPRQSATKHAGVSKRAILFAVCAVLIAILGIFVAAEAEHNRAEEERRAAEELALNTPRSVEVRLGIPTSEATHTMPVAVHVVGTTKKDAQIDEVKVVSLDEPSLLLAPGLYSVNLAGNTLSNDGFYYKGSIDTFEIEVATDGVYWRESPDDQSPQDEAEEKDEAAQTTRTQAKPVFAFAMVAPERVTDEDIQAAQSCLEAVSADYSSYAEAAYARKTEALDRIRAEGEARDAEQTNQAEGIIWYVDQQLSARALAKEEEAKKRNDDSSTTHTEEQTKEEGQ